MPSGFKFDVSHEIALGFTTAAPFVLRLVGGKVQKWFVKKVMKTVTKCCCKKTPGQAAMALLGSGGTDDNVSFTIHEGLWGKTSFSEAAERQGLERCAPYFVASMRLFLWHYLQPVAYWFVLWLYWDDMSRTQQILGAIVAGREGIYFLLVTIALFVQPAFLLVDVVATFKEDPRWLIRIVLYVLTPEKFVLRSLQRYMSNITSILLLLGLALIDSVGIAALVVALTSGHHPAALLIGYAITTAGALLMPNVLLRY
jgi:hypothetical protein